MKTIEPSFEIIKQEPTIVGMQKHCEKAARICYRSEDKITDNSYEKLLDTLHGKRHYSPLAHGTVTMKFTQEEWEDFFVYLDEWDVQPGITAFEWFSNPMWTRVDMDDEDNYCITTNYRLITELGLEHYMESNWCEPGPYHVDRVTVKVTLSRVIATEWNRHASGLAICGESTRYCCYGKDKFEGQIKVVEPLWLKDADPEIRQRVLDSWQKDEDEYLYLVNNGVMPPDARGVLPLDLATTMYYTGFIDEWEHIFDLRTSAAAHPEIRRIMGPLQKAFRDRNLLYS